MPYSTVMVEEVTFTSTSVAPNGDGKRPGGDLTIAGNTRPIAMDFDFQGVAVDPWALEGGLLRTHDARP